jgi:hypothetical protein
MKRNCVVAAVLLLAALSLAWADPLPPGYIPKWIQLPDMSVTGADFHSMHQPNGTVVVDDFRSDGRPILGFVWWGSYLAGGPAAGTPQRQLNFELSFHADVPVGPNVFSVPANAYQFQILNAWENFFQNDANGVPVYEYWALLTTPWTEIAGNIYWFDVALDFASNPGANWGRRNSATHWNDAAVQTLVPGLGGNPHTGTWALVGGGQDMSFEVLTQVPEPAGLLLFIPVLAATVRLMRRR